MEASTNAASYVKTKMDETGVTSGAQAAGSAVYSAGVAGASTIKSSLDSAGVTEKAQAAGSYVYESGASSTNYMQSGFNASSSYINDTIEGNDTLAGMRRQA